MILGHTFRMPATLHYRLIRFNTKHISLVLAVIDTSFTAILPIIFGFKL